MSIIISIGEYIRAEVIEAIAIFAKYLGDVVRSSKRMILQHLLFKLKTKEKTMRKTVEVM